MLKVKRLVFRYVWKLKEAIMVSTLRYLLVTLLVLIANGAAASGDWTAMKATKQVAYTVDNQNWITVKSGDVIPNRA